MKIILRILSCMVIFLISEVYAESIKKNFISPNGDTIIIAESKEIKVQVNIRTHVIKIGKPSEKKSDDIKTTCTYSKYPCSVVENIHIAVNGKQIIVPKSVFCDLADLNTGEIEIGQKELFLTLNGGDASESYMAQIEFDSLHVKHRRLSSLMEPGKILQETIYNLQTLKDE